MHNSDFVLPREVVLAVYCPDCEKPEKALMYHEAGWAIRYSMRVLASQLWTEKEMRGHRESVEATWEFGADTVLQWLVDGQQVKGTYRDRYGRFAQYEKAQRWFFLWRLEGVLELDRKIEAARREYPKRWALAELLGKGWASFNGDPNEMCDDV